MNGNLGEEFRAMLQEAVAGSINTPARRIELFTGAGKTDVVRWVEEFEYLANAAGWSDNLKVRKLPLYLAEYARDWYSVYISSLAEHPAWPDLKRQLKDFFLPTSYDNYLRDQLDRKNKQVKNVFPTIY